LLSGPTHENLNFVIPAQAGIQRIQGIMFISLAKAYHREYLKLFCFDSRNLTAGFPPARE